MQDSGSLAVFKVTARDQGHYKGPSGAFVTYCNISCFFSSGFLPIYDFRSARYKWKGSQIHINNNPRRPRFLSSSGTNQDRHGHRTTNETPIYTVTNYAKTFNIGFYQFSFFLIGTALTSQYYISYRQSNKQHLKLPRKRTEGLPWNGQQ